jgi:hypothetical protein
VFVSLSAKGVADSIIVASKGSETLSAVLGRARSDATLGAQYLFDGFVGVDGQTSLATASLVCRISSVKSDNRSRASPTMPLGAMIQSGFFADPLDIQISAS